MKTSIENGQIHQVGSPGQHPLKLFYIPSDGMYGSAVCKNTCEKEGGMQHLHGQENECKQALSLRIRTVWCPGKKALKDILD